MNERNPETKSLLMARIIRELLKAEAFESLADLTDALKFRCSRLRIRYTPDDITDAFRLIASNTELVHRPRRRGYEPPPEPPMISHDEARAILDRLGVRL